MILFEKRASKLRFLQIYVCFASGPCGAVSKPGDNFGVVGYLPRSYMKFAAKGSFKPNKNNREQPQPVSLVLGILATVLVLCCTFLSPQRHFANPGSSVRSADLPPYWQWLEADVSNASQGDAARPIYAYSVIPGGAMNSKELKQALARDPVAASHYAGFHTQSAKPVRLAQARKVYVSYRVGNRIYWTSKKVALHAGETLLSDGAHLVRGRCGNRISELPARPNSPAEPPEPVLDAPVLSRVLAYTADLVAPPPIWSEHPTPFLLALGPASPPMPSNGPFIPPLPVLPCCGGSSAPQTPTKPPTPPVTPPPPVIPQPGPGPSPNPLPTSPPNTPPVATPEPQTLELLCIGLVGAFVLLKLRYS